MQAIPWYDAAWRRLLVEKVAKGASNGEQIVQILLLLNCSAH